MRSVLLLLFFPLIGLSQQLEYVDFLQIDARLDFNNELQKVEGSYNVKFQVLKSIDSIYLDAKSMRITNVEERKLRVVANENKIWIYGPFDQGKSYSTDFRYEAFPAQTLYFTEDQIWTQGQGKYTSHWLPSIDDMNDKIEFDLTVVARGDVRVIANGTLSTTTPIEDKVAWHFDMERPMSSYLAAVVVGDFAMKRDTSNSGIPLELYYKPEDSLKAEPTYRFTNEIFDFLEEEIGIDYPWQNYKQVPVRDFLYAGMENTTLTIFSEAFVVDSIGYNDRNYVNVN
ncbi:MAG: M1 family peptidase, partial [Bacteroidia bacterium]|nr:M1 family peptidase [Bacteroidia bacterium]